MGAAGGIVGEYEALQAETDADLLAMQVGDFYEFFGRGAEIVHEELDLQLSSKPSGGERHPMAGVPVSEIDRYALALVERGYRVAIADQRAGDPDHSRAVDRIVTPGTALERSPTRSNFLAAVAEADGAVGLALVDVSVGRCFVDGTTTIGSAADLLEALAALDVAEVILDPTLGWLDDVGEGLDARVTEPDAADLPPRRARSAVADRFGEGIADSLGLDQAAECAVGAVVAYLEATDPSLLACLDRLERYRSDDAVTLDATTTRNLELTETFRGEAEGSLLATVDHTVTTAGGRTLRERLHRPTRDRDVLGRRLAAIDALQGAPLVRDELRDLLKGTADLDRLATRCVHGSATPRDLGSVRQTLSRLPRVLTVVEGDPSLGASAVADGLDPLRSAAVERLGDRLTEALVDDPPASDREGGIFRRGWRDELDDVIDEHEAVEGWFDGLADREADRHGFTTVELGRTKTDGHYLQVAEDEVDLAPEAYEKVKTVAAGTRFRTDELARKERRLVQLEERRAGLERAAFEELREEVAAAADALRTAGRALAGLDVHVALAQHAARNDWRRPTFRDDGVIEIDRGRHPVVEQTTRFVPNDVRFDGTSEQLLVTGPNMSGKSTFLRQVASITLLAQIGSFVPADRAAITPVDGIFTRVGALDELARGRSTFMVEMQELARILHHASPDSLVVLDEVGRGTATYDGLSIAWAATEYLHNVVSAKTLFATHYHELTVLADHLEGVANLHVEVDETADRVAFLRTVAPGATDRSYGVNVAEMAGVPDPVVDRAHEVLDRLREEKAVEARAAPGGPKQVVFDLASGSLRAGDGRDADPGESVLDELAGLDLEATSPLDLLERVRDWQASLERSDR